MASAISFAVNPIDLIEIASTPARAPGPKMTTKISAQMMTFTERVNEMMNLPSTYTGSLGVVLLARRNATGIAITVASAERG